jgi:DNA excision repair protein ERCC-2
MSGTLKPLDEFHDSIGLPPNSPMVSYPSPFPIDNRAIFYATDVTTKYEIISQDKQIIKKMKKYILDVCNNLDKNTVIFFPSFGLMQQFLDDGVHLGLKNNFYIETQGMKQHTLMDLVENFKIKQRSALFSVIGGRISEGLDFPAETLEIIIIAGIPYPKPSAKQRALEHYYDLKFGKGWEYTVNAPAARKLLQSIGRLIRDEKDRGVVLILDKRANRFNKYLKGLKSTWNPIDDLKRFF